MRILAIALLMLLGSFASIDGAHARTSRKVCADQQKGLHEELCRVDLQVRVPDVHEIVQKVAEPQF
jgi:hypothetical protein